MNQYKILLPNPFEKVEEKKPKKAKKKPVSRKKK
jgi:hypothetical protein